MGRRRKQEKKKKKVFDYIPVRGIIIPENEGKDRLCQLWWSRSLLGVSGYLPIPSSTSRFSLLLLLHPRLQKKPSCPLTAAPKRFPILLLLWRPAADIAHTILSDAFPHCLFGPALQEARPQVGKALLGRAGRVLGEKLCVQRRRTRRPVE